MPQGKKTSKIICDAGNFSRKVTQISGFLTDMDYTQEYMDYSHECKFARIKNIHTFICCDADEKKPRKSFVMPEIFLAK